VFHDGYILAIIEAFALVIFEVEVEKDGFFEYGVSMLMVDQLCFSFFLICIGGTLRRFHCTLV
jgi:hypothetical protein